MKKKALLLGALILAVVVTAFSVSGTYAKYVSASDATDTARVAQWGFTIDGKTTETLNFFKDFDNVTPGESAGYTALIAPGTHGSYSFGINGTAEVAYNLNIAVTGEDNVNGFTTADGTEYNPINYSLKDNNGRLLYAGYKINELIGALNADLVNDNGDHAAGDSVATPIYEISWEWAYEGNDVYDTELGAAVVANPDAYNVSLSVSIAATQIEPVEK